MTSRRPPRRKWTNNPWEPESDYKALFRGRSGNDYNGLGEEKPRKPKRIFWLTPSSDGPFSELQDLAVKRYNSLPVLDEVYAKADRGPKPGHVSREQVGKSAQAWTREVRQFALNHDADIVGVAETEEDWYYEGFERELPRVIVIAVRMDHGRAEVLPSTPENPEWVHEVGVQYNRGARAARYLTRWIKQQGYEAKPHAGPWVGSMNLIPAAIAAGLGQLGKHGSMINRQFGSSFRLSAVETDMPLIADSPDEFGSDDFCERCQVCTIRCPPQAITDEKQTVRGVEKWYVDFDKCIGYFSETYSCGICIAVCPWSTTGRGPILAEKWSKRARRA